MDNQKPAAIVRVHRPSLTPEEREKRLEQIRKAAIAVILAAERNNCSYGIT